MLDNTNKRKIDSARDILVGKIPDPKAQVEQITTALIYKFMDDMDLENEEAGLSAQFFVDDYAKYSWRQLMDNRLSGQERMDLYVEAVANIPKAKNIPQLFRDIFKGAFLPFRDPRTLSLFLKEINEFSYDNSENLGNAFEYLLSILGSQGDAGQFRTPRHIIDFIVEVVNPQKNETILDPACGTAGFLISAYKHIFKTNSSNFKPEEEKAEDKIVQGETATETVITDKINFSGDLLSPDDKTKLTQNIVGYDISPDMVKLALVNLYLHGFSDPKIFEYDTLSSDKRWDEHFDVILANPPFMTPKGGISPHKRFSIQANRAEVLFVDYIAEHLSIKGRAGIIVPEGIIFQSGNAYKNLRKNLIENWGLFAVVSLPSGVFQPYSGVKTSILLLDREFAKRSKEILFLKVEHDGFDLGAQRRKIDKNDLPECLKVLNEWKTTPLAPLVRVEETHPNPPLSGREEKEFAHIPYNQKLTELARKNRKNPTKAEQKMWNNVLRAKNLSNYKFHRQKPLDNFIADFYCSKLRLIIEIDGDSHADKKEYDEIRTEILNQYGLTVVRYTNDEVLNNIEGVYEDLIKKITPLSKTLSLSEGNKPTPVLAYQAGCMESSPLIRGDVRRTEGFDKGDLGGLAFTVKKSKIAGNGDYNLTGDRYREVTDYSNAKWEMVELGELLEEKTERAKDQDIQVWSVSNTQGFVNTEEYFEKQVASVNTSNYKIINSNYFAYNPSRINVGSIAFNESKNIGCVSPMYVVFEIADQKLNADYLFKILKSKEADKEINLKSQGAVRKQLRYKDLITIQIPLPPLEVQEQIVAEIERYQKVIDGAKQVVKNWKPSFRIDPSWEMVELGEVANKFQYGSSKKSIPDGDIPCLRMGNIQNREIDWSNLKYAPTDEEFDKYSLSKNDVLFNRTNSPDLVGKTAIYRGERKAVFAGYLIRIDYDRHKILGEYLNYCMNTESAKDFCNRVKTDGVSQSNINAKTLSTFRIPLPPLEVQEQIVAELEAEQKAIEECKKLIEKMERKIKAKIGEVWGDEIGNEEF